MSETFSPEKVQFFDDIRNAPGRLALSYDDVRLETRHGRGIRPPEVIDTSGAFSRNVPLREPFVSAAMNTVTESAMAIAMAEFGGIGVIHAALSPEDQKHEVRRVKLFMNGVIDKPVTVDRNATLREVLTMCDEKSYGFRTFPVINNEGRFVGLLTGNDFDFVADKETRVKDAMTPKSEVLSKTGKVGIEDAYKLMTKNKKKTLPILDKNGRVKKLFLHSDVNRILNESSGFNVDVDGRLVVAAAVPTDAEAIERVRLMHKYLDVLVLDSANGDAYYAFETLEAIKSEFPDLDVVVGNVSTGDSARELAEAGADGVKVGQGPGSICTTRDETGIGKPQVTAIFDCVRAVEKYGIPICADGGIRFHGDISIALAVGARSVMMGRVLAGATESPGPIIELADGSRVKDYYGMGSARAFAESAASRKRYQANAKGPRLAEGVEARVPHIGPVASELEMCRQGLLASLRYLKAYDLETHRRETQLFQITNAGRQESHPHSVAVTRR